MQIVRVIIEAGRLQRSTSAWHQGFRVGVCRMGTHIMALWARQPLSNYCKPSPALLRHALNFAQDRWGPAEYAAESRFPTANRRCLWIMSSLLLKRPATRRAKNGSLLLAGESSASWVLSALCWALWAEIQICLRGKLCNDIMGSGLQTESVWSLCVHHKHLSFCSPKMSNDHMVFAPRATKIFKKIRKGDILCVIRSSINRAVWWRGTGNSFLQRDCRFQNGQGAK